MSSDAHRTISARLSSRHPSSPRRSAFPAILLLTLPALILFAPALRAQSVPPALASPPAGPPESGPHGEKLPGMPRFHDPAPYDFDEHTGYQQIFDTKSLAGWDADPTIWRVENDLMVGETTEGHPRGNNYIVYRGRQSPRLRPQAPNENRKRRRRRHSIPQPHRRPLDTPPARRPAAL